MQVKYMEQVTATDARKWLALNRENRRLSRIRVEQIAQAIVRDEWRPNTDAIGIEGTRTSGRLINGQHRLTGLVLADDRKPGVTIPLTLAWDLGPDSGGIIDTGKSRSLEDTLFFLGEDEARPRHLSAALTLAWHIAHGTYVHRMPTPTRPQQLDFLKQAPDLRDAVPLGQVMARGARMPASGLMAAVWMIGRGAHVNRLDQFVNEVAHGEGLTQRDMTYRLRELFASWTANRNVDRGRPWKTCALTTYTWNAWLVGERKNLSLVRLTEIPVPL